MTRLMFQKKALKSSDRETQRFIACDHRLDALEHVRQRGRVHYLRSRVAHLFHHDSDAATALVVALATSHVRRFADAWQRRDRPVQHAYNVPHADLAGVAAEEISAALALLALEQPLVLELEQNQLEELVWNTFAPRHIGNKHGALSIFLGQNQHRLERVFRFL